MRPSTAAAVLCTITAVTLSEPPRTPKWQAVWQQGRAYGDHLGPQRARLLLQRERHRSVRGLPLRHHRAQSGALGGGAGGAFGSGLELCAQRVGASPRLRQRRLRFFAPALGELLRGVQLGTQRFDLHFLRRLGCVRVREQRTAQK